MALKNVKVFVSITGEDEKEIEIKKTPKGFVSVNEAMKFLSDFQFENAYESQTK